MDTGSGTRFIDMDTHVYEPIEIFAKYADPGIREHAPRWVRDDTDALRFAVDEQLYPAPGLFEKGLAWVFDPDSPYMQIKGAHDPVERLKFMDAEGAHAHVIFPSLAQFGFGRIRDPKLAGGLCRAYNRWIAEFASVDRSRLRPAMILPYNHIEVALQELTFAVEELGLKILYANPTPPPGLCWHHPTFDPLWTAAEEGQLLVAFHESSSASSNGVGLDRYRDYSMIYLCGKVVEMQLACMDIILGQVLRRHPRLSVGFFECFAAWLPGWLALMDSQYPKTSTQFDKTKDVPLELTPTEFFKKNCMIQVFPDDVMVDETVRAVGEDRVLLGTDYPHPISTAGEGLVRQNAAAFFRSRQPALTAGAIERLQWGNAQRVLRL
jgi:predicted TIM-barrel fold metal-dependent hydrolase